MQTALGRLKRHKAHEVIQIARTWFNSWSTTHRFHEESRLPCLLGCVGKPDSLTHYARCDRMRYLMSLLVGVPTTWPGFCDLGTLDPCDEALKCVSCMYYAYHTVRFSSSMFVREIQSHIHDGDPCGSQHITTTTFSVASDDACRCFIGAFRASALLAELAVHSVSFPLNVSFHSADLPIQQNNTSRGMPAADPLHAGSSNTRYRITSLGQQPRLNSLGQQPSRPSVSTPRGTASSSPATFFTPAREANAHNPFLSTNERIPTMDSSSGCASAYSHESEA